MTLAKVLRLVGVVGIVAAVSVVAQPARAHHSITFDNCSDQSSPSPSADPDASPAASEEPAEATPAPGDRTPPPQDCMPDEGEIIWGTRTLRFAVNSDQFRPIKKVDLYILADEKDLPNANQGKPVATWTYTEDEAPASETYRFSWDSVTLTPRNGRYKVRVEASTYEPAEQTHTLVSPDRRNLRVDNPPKAVPAPKILATTFSTVTVRWETAKEPDVLSYTVYRAVTDDDDKRPRYEDFKQVAVRSSNSYRDDDVKPGVHWYTVRVARRSVVTPKTGITSALSPISGPGEVESLPEVGGDTNNDGGGPRRFIPFRSLSRSPTVSGSAAGVPDAPFAYKLPYDDKGAPAFGSSVEGGSEEPGTDPRGPVLPVAVGMFLVSSALAVGRMPY